MYILEIILILSVLVAIHELGHFLAAKSIKVPVRQFALGFGPALLKRRWGETEVMLNALPLGGYCAFEDDEDPEAQGDPAKMLRHRGWWERAYVISAGVICNFLAAYLVLVAMVSFVGVPILKPGVSVGNLMPKMPAITAGFKAGDEIKSVDAQPVKSAQDVINALHSRAQKTVTVGVLRNGQTLNLQVTPNAQGKIGVGLQSQFITQKPKTVWDPLVMGAQQQAIMTKDLMTGLGQLFTGKMPLSQVGGPIEIVNIGSKVAQANHSNLFAFTALISIELAIVNFLPLPALDGGRMIMLLLEAIRRRPLPTKVENNINQVGLLLLLGLGMVLIIKDIVSLTLQWLGG